MTQDTRPMTRRELRLAAERAATPQAPLPSSTPVAVAERPDPQTAPQPLTRRALRLAALEQAAATSSAQDAPSSTLPTPAAEPTTPIEAVAASTEKVVTAVVDRTDAADAAPARLAYVPTQRTCTAGNGRTLTPARMAKAGTVLALSAGLVTSAVALQGEDVPALAETAPSAADLAQERQARIQAAEAARLTAQAEQHAAVERREALAVAQAALETASTVATEAAPVVDPEIVAALDEAMAELETMVASSAVPTPPAELRSQDVPAPDVDDASAPTDDESPVPAEDEIGREAAAAAARDLTPASRAAVERAPLTDVVATPDAPSTEESPDEAAASTVDETTASDESTASELGALSPEVTDQVLAAAQRVTDLSAEVQAATEAKIAEAEAKAAAEAAAAAAAAELERKVALAASSPNGRIPMDALCAPEFAPQELLRCDAAEALEELNAAYRADFGVDLDVVSSYRSYSAQIATRANRGWLAAAPGTSNHGLGLAVDFGNFGGLGQFNTKNYWWMKENGPEYGWEHPRLMEPGGGGPQEPWHWEFDTGN